LIEALPGLRWVLGGLPSFLGGAPSHLGGARRSEGGAPSVLLGARGFLLGWPSSELGECTSVGRERVLELGACLKLLGSCPEKTGAWVLGLGFSVMVIASVDCSSANSRSSSWRGSRFWKNDRVTRASIPIAQGLDSLPCFSSPP
jgi:hypothetical protein